MSRISLAGTL